MMVRLRNSTVTIKLKAKKIKIKVEHIKYKGDIIKYKAKNLKYIAKLHQIKGETLYQLDNVIRLFYK